MDIAPLGFQVDSNGVVTAKVNLTAMTAAAGQAEKAVEGLAGDARSADVAVHDLGDEARTTAGAFDQMTRAANDAPMTRYAQGIGKAGKTAGVASHDLKNMVYQLNDVGVSLAGGMNPLMVFIQQGSQIGQVAATSGAGIGQWAKALGLFNPLVLAAAAALGIAAGAFALFKSDIDKAADNKAFIASLHLSDKELKKLGDTSVSIGDVMSGFWKTIDQDGKVSKTFKDIADTGVSAFRFILEGVEWFVAGAFAGLNAVAKAMKGVAMVATGDMAGFDVFNHSLDGLVSDTKAAKANMDAFWASVQKNTISANHDRIRDRANQIIKDRTTDKKKEREEIDPKWAVRGDYSAFEEKEGRKITPWDDFTKLGKQNMRDFEDSLKRLPSVIHPIRDEFKALSKDIADSLGEAIAYGDDLGEAVSNAFKRIAAEYISSGIQTIFAKLIDSASAYMGRGDTKYSSSPSYDGGGYTGSGSRTGGLDGKGGFWAVMHPKETVVDHTRGQSMGGTTINAPLVQVSTAGAGLFTPLIQYINGQIRDAHDSAVAKAGDNTRRAFPGLQQTLGEFGAT